MPTTKSEISTALRENGEAPYGRARTAYAEQLVEAAVQTGDRPLTERARWLQHADAFVGLSSGLAWLAWAAGAPSVVVSGFTHPTNEFTTPYRVINWHTCNSCWNDPAVRFKHDDFMWCPRHQNTSRHFECTRLITGDHVIAQIDRALASRSAPSSQPA